MTIKPGDIVELADGTVIGPIKNWPGGGGFCKSGIYYWEPNGEAYYSGTRVREFDVVAVVTVTRVEGEG